MATRGSIGLGLARKASKVSAAIPSIVSISPARSWSARAPSPVETALAAHSASPSFSKGSTTAIPALRIASAPSSHSPPRSARPSPSSGNAMLAQSARSEAPSEPMEGTQGWTPASSMAQSVSTTSGRAPEPPRAMALARANMAARAASARSGSPAPQARARIVTRL